MKSIKTFVLSFVLTVSSFVSQSVAHEQFPKDFFERVYDSYADDNNHNSERVKKHKIITILRMLDKCKAADQSDEETFMSAKVLSIHLAIELSEANKRSYRCLEFHEGLLVNALETLPNLTEAYVIEDYLREIEIRKEMVKKIKADIEFIENLQKKYCPFFSEF